MSPSTPPALAPARARTSSPQPPTTSTLNDKGHTSKLLYKTKLGQRLRSYETPEETKAKLAQKSTTGSTAGYSRNTDKMKYGPQRAPTSASDASGSPSRFTHLANDIGESGRHCNLFCATCVECRPLVRAFNRVKGR